MTISAARRTENIVYAIRNIVTYAKQLEKKGLKITYLNIGDPNVYDFETPDFMISAAYEAMKKNKNFYAHSYGIEEARKAVALDEMSKGKIGIEPDDVIITSGASEAIEIALTALLNEGESVLLPVPGYPLYSAVVAKINARMTGYKLDYNNNWQPDLNDLESKIDKTTKAIVVINPNNPTGMVYSKKSLEGILALCRKHNLLLLSDEIYDRTLFEDISLCYPSNLAKDVPIVSFNGLSKNFLAPGWRIGWMVFQNMKNETAYLSAIKKIVEARLCACTPLQHVIAPALSSGLPHLAGVMKKLKARRDLSVERLNSINRVSCTSPEAAFYAMPRVEGIKDDEKFIKTLLEKTGILFVYGSGFGMKKEEGAFRLVYLPEEKVLEKAFDTFEKFVKDYN